LGVDHLPLTGAVSLLADLDLVEQGPEFGEHLAGDQAAACLPAAQVFQRVHVVREPLTDYLRYELGWSYPPNVEAGEDIRILVAQAGSWPMSARGEILPDLKDYWLFDSSDLWVMEYADDGAFLSIELVTEPAMIVTAARRRDVALQQAISYRDYVRRAELLAAS
jgi:hypothetical protein